MQHNNEEIEFHNLQVGKKFPLYQKSVEKMNGNDGAFFEANDLKQGYHLCIMLSNVNFTDKTSFTKDKIQVRVLQGDDGMVLPMIQFGKSLMFELVFDPTLYDDSRALQFVETTNIVTLILIESNNGIIKGLRQCNLPVRMIQICKEAWGRAILDMNFSEKFNQWINRMSKYPLSIIWERATKAGFMGEVYDLNDIKIPTTEKKEEGIEMELDKKLDEHLEHLRKEAENAKEHFLKHKTSVADVKCIESEMDATKQVFREVLGEELLKRVVFIALK